MAKLYVGTSGYIQQKNFYPGDVKGKDKLKYYATQFNSAEINSSFYRTPSENSLKTWKESVPEGFIFTFKVLKYILMPNTVHPESLEKWFTRFQIFENQNHVMLFQYAASRKGNPEYLVDLLQQLPKTFRYAFEFRHPTWFTKEIFAVMRKYNASLVLSDSPRKLTGGRTWPMIDEDTADFTFIRFHGSLVMYASGYLPGEMKGYSDLVKKKMEAGKDVFCYFNNDILGFSITNARELISSTGQGQP